MKTCQALELTLISVMASKLTRGLRAQDGAQSGPKWPKCLRLKVPWQPFFRLWAFLGHFGQRETRKSLTPEAFFTKKISPIILTQFSPQMTPVSFKLGNFPVICNILRLFCNKNTRPRKKIYFCSITRDQKAQRWLFFEFHFTGSVKKN